MHIKVCLEEWKEKWMIKKICVFFYLVEKKSEIMENVICLNLLSCLYYITTNLKKKKKLQRSK
jgi:hypothetical protein